MQLEWRTSILPPPSHPLNMAVPPTDPNSPHRAAIEGFPHILQKITLMWGTRELELFIGHLIMDARGGSRQGFPMDAAHEMLFLSETNRIIRAIDTAKTLNVKLADAYKMVMAGDEAAMKTSSWDDPSVTMDTISRKHSRSAANPQSDQGAEGENLFARLGSIVLKPWFLVVLALALSFRMWMPTAEKYLSLFFY